MHIFAVAHKRIQFLFPYTSSWVLWTQITSRSPPPDFPRSPPENLESPHLTYLQKAMAPPAAHGAIAAGRSIWLPILNPTINQGRSSIRASGLTLPVLASGPLPVASTSAARQAANGTPSRPRRDGGVRAGRRHGGCSLPYPIEQTKTRVLLTD